MYNPTVDLLTAKWSPFEDVSWVLPLQNELTEWRNKLMVMEENLLKQSENIDVAFVTDFPGKSRKFKKKKKKIKPSRNL